MKKTLLKIVLLGFLVGIYGFERFHDTTVSSYLMTPSGVDYIRIGRTFVDNPPQGALYDRTIKDGNTYLLFRNNEPIGSVLVDEGTKSITSVVLYNCPVHLDNGISIGSHVRDAVRKEAVQVYVTESFNFESSESEYDILLVYSGIEITLTDDCLSARGKYKARNKASDFKAEDFDSKGIIKSFKLTAS